MDERDQFIFAVYLAAALGAALAVSMLMRDFIRQERLFMDDVLEQIAEIDRKRSNHVQDTRP